MANLVDIGEWLQEKGGNPDYERQLYLTEEEVRSFEEFKDAPPEEIANIIETLHEFALVTYELFYTATLKKQQAERAA